MPSLFEAGPVSQLAEADIATEARGTPARREGTPSEAEWTATAVPSTEPMSQPAGQLHREREIVRELRTETAQPPLPPPPVTFEREREIVEQQTVIERHFSEVRETELRELLVERIAPPGAPVKLPAGESRTGSAAVPSRPPASAGLTAPTRYAGVPHMETTADEQPAVRITIGRVEVRAVCPPATQAGAPKRRTAPVMPLEDYLKQGDRRAR